MDYRALFISTSVKQDKDIIIITLPHAETLITDITRQWRTSKITNNIFREIKLSKLTIDLFFAVEIYYLISNLLDMKLKNRAKLSQSFINTPIKILKRIKEEFEKNTWLSSIFGNESTNLRLDLSLLSDMVFKPLDYQMGFLNYYSSMLTKYNLKGTLLYASPGTGKTFTSLAVATCLGKQVDHVIVLSPNNALFRVWDASLNINNDKCLFNTKQSYWVNKSNTPYNNEKFIVVNYEYLEKLLDIVKSMRNKNFMIILDESHNLNEISSTRTQLFIELCKVTNSNNTILMSGTPIKALGKETIPLFSAIDPYFTPKVEERFRSIYGAAKNVAADMLSYRLGMVTFKVEKEVLKLDKPIFKDILIKLSNGEEFTLKAITVKMKDYIEERKKYYDSRKEEDHKVFFDILKKYRDHLTNGKDIQDYNDYLKNIEIIKQATLFNELGYIPGIIKAANIFEKRLMDTLSPDEKKVFKNVKSIYKYLKLKIQGECLGNILGKERTRCNVEIAKAVDYESIIENAVKKTIIFTSFVDVLKIVDETLQKENYKPIVVYGETNKDLNAAINKFEYDESINPLIATYQSLSTAVPLTMADNMILLNQPFRDYILNQAISRIHRLNADTQVYVYNVLLDTGSEPNISTRSADILKWSQEQVNELLGIKLDSSIGNLGDDINVSTESLINLIEGAPYTSIKSRLKDW